MTRIESLESRRLMAVTAAVSSSGTLVVQGTDSADTITVFRDGQNFVATERGKIVLSAPASGVRRIDVQAGGGNDAVVITSRVNRKTMVVGGMGDDTLEARNTQTTLIGGSGNDRLVSAPDTASSITLNPEARLIPVYAGTIRFSQNVLSGGAGKDTLVAGTANERLTGGSGVDEFVLTDPKVAVSTVELPDPRFVRFGVLEMVVLGVERFVQPEAE